LWEKVSNAGLSTSFHNMEDWKRKMREAEEVTNFPLNSQHMLHYLHFKRNPV
jgi:hypothetical protein